MTNASGTIIVVWMNARWIFNKKSKLSDPSYGKIVLLIGIEYTEG